MPCLFTRSFKLFDFQIGPNQNLNLFLFKSGFGRLVDFGNLLQVLLDLLDNGGLVGDLDDLALAGSRGGSVLFLNLAKVSLSGGCHIFLRLSLFQSLEPR